MQDKNEDCIYIYFFVVLNILFVANRFPFPPFRGDKLKIYNLTRRLAAKHDLFLVTFYEKREELNYLKDIQPYFKEIELVYLPKWRSVLNGIPALFSSTPLQLAYFKSSKMKRMVQFAIDQYDIDVVHTQHLRMSQYTRKIDLPKILDLPDAFSLYFKRRKETERPLVNRLIDILSEFTMVVDGMHSFSHEIYREVVYDKYVCSRDNLIRWHQLMARYFSQLETGPRKWGVKFDL